MNKISFLTLAEVILIHGDQITRYGGHAGIRDLGLLRSSIAMPEAVFEGEYLHSDIFEMAAAYAFHICQNHPFIDGNKRTALVCALLFLELNGVSILDPKKRFYSVIMEMASGKVDKNQFAEVLRNLPQE
jgi:death-on-curing protein